MTDRSRALAVLCAAQAMAMLIWYNFSAVLPLLRTEWTITNAEAGTLLAVFQTGYVLSVLVTGWLADRYGGRIVFVVCAIETGLAGIGFVLFADGYWSGAVWRTLAGIGQAGLYVPGMQILSRHYPPEQRGKAIGIYTCSLVAAYAGAYFIASPLAAAFGWQTALLWTSVWALPAGLLVYRFVPDAPPVAAFTGNKGPGFVGMFSMSRAAWLIIAGYAGHMWELYAFWGWIGAYLTHYFVRLGFDASTALSSGGILAAGCILVGGVSPGVAGWASDRFGRSATAIGALVVSAACSFTFGWLDSAAPTVVAAVGLVYGLSVVADSAVFKAGLTELVPPGRLGAALSVQSVVGFGVTILSTKLFGIFADSLGWGAAFTLLGVGALAGVFAMARLRRLPEATAMAGGRR